MLTTIPGRFDTTFLSPGQQFASTDPASADAGSLTVSRLVRDRYGLMHVTMRTGSGREISAFVEQVELAVSEGHLVPVGNTAAVSC